jgi:hypothetical protein
VHKPIPEYASTADIPTTPFSYSWCSHFYPTQIKIEVCFLLNYLQNPLVIPKIKRRGRKKKRNEKVLKKERKELQKSNEKGMNIFREEKNISTSNLPV